MAAKNLAKNFTCLHGQRTASCLDIQPSTLCRVCTVGLGVTERHCSSQFEEYYMCIQNADQRDVFVCIANRVYFLATY